MLNAVGRLVFFSALAAGLAVCPLGIDAVRAQSFVPDDGVRATSLEELPLDATLVVSAAVLTMRGDDATVDRSRVAVAPPAKKALREPRFRYEGFELTSYVLTAYGEPSAFPDAVMASAILTFADAGARRTTVSLVVEYGLAGQKIEIMSAEAVTLTPPSPEVRMFVVPTADVPESMFTQTTSRLELLQHVEAKALTFEALRRLPPGPRDFYVFAFYQDRLPRDAEVQLRVGREAGGIDGDPVQAANLNFNGWRVSTMYGRFALGSGTEFFIKAVYKAGGTATAQERPLRVVGAMSSYLGPPPGSK